MFGRGFVYYELLKPRETVNTKRYQQQLTDFNRFLLGKKMRKLKETTQSHFLHYYAPSYTLKPVTDMSEALSWEILRPVAYSPD